MILDCDEQARGWERVWKCLGCGRERLVDDEAQELDDRLLERILQAGR
jgi:DNA transposition AAA+ family ATPase